MEITVTARHFKASNELREEAIKAAKKLERFFEKIISTEIVLSNEKQNKENPKNVEFLVHVQDHTLVVKESGDEFFKIIHEASEKMVRRLRKLKTKYTGV